MPENEETTHKLSQAGDLDQSWVNIKVRVRVAETLIVEDTLLAITHTFGDVRLVFANTRRIATIFSSDEGFRVVPSTPVEVID